MTRVKVCQLLLAFCIMDIETLEKVISGLRISKPKYRGKNVEDSSLPFMLSTFRKLIRNEVPPTQQEFIDKFKTEFPDTKSRGLTSRLKRAYLSYVREYHLGYLLRKYFKRVIYDEEIDIAGVDYVIKYRGRKFNIHAYVDTAGGNYWREVKNGRHKFRGTHLDLPMDLTTGKRCGKLILYTDDQILKLKDEMDRIIKAKRKADAKR